MTRSLILFKLHKIYDIPRNVNDIFHNSTHSSIHTFGTRCIESGIVSVVTQRLMGHEDIGATLNTYTSALDKFKEQEY